MIAVSLGRNSLSRSSGGHWSQDGGTFVSDGFLLQGSLLLDGCSQEGRHEASSWQEFETENLHSILHRPSFISTSRGSLQSSGSNFQPRVSRYSSSFQSGAGTLWKLFHVSRCKSQNLGFPWTFNNPQPRSQT